MNTLKPQAQAACNHDNTTTANGEQQLLKHIFSESDDLPCCTCDYYAPSIWKLTSPAFLAALAGYIAARGLPASQSVYWMLDKLYGQSTGTLHDLNERPIDLFATFKDAKGNEIDIIDSSFGKSWARGMHRFLERCRKPFKNQMKRSPRLLMRILLMHYTCEIDKCATKGACSKRKN